MKEKPLRSYGRIRGRTLKPRQARLVETLLPLIEIPAEGRVELDALFAPLGRAPPCGGGEAKGEDAGGAARLDSGRSESGRHILEIGFGGGEHLVAQAQAHPDWRFLGVEPFLNGVASCLRHIDETGVRNVRLRQGDARDVLVRLPDAKLDRVYVLFPDPWPKRRHWKRRLIQRHSIAELARVLKTGGEVRFATDWKHYAAWTLELFLQDARFRWTAACADDWRRPWSGHATTRYEQKRLGDTAAIFLTFVRG